MRDRVDFNRNTPFPNMRRVLTQPWFFKTCGWGGGGGVGGGPFGEVGYKRQTESQDCAVSPVWFGPSREPAGLIRT